MSRKRRKPSAPSVRVRSREALPETAPAILRETHVVDEHAEGSSGARRHWRNLGEHPLTLAYARGKLGALPHAWQKPCNACDACRRAAAGEKFRWCFERLHAFGRDSTLSEPGVHGTRAELGTSQEAAGQAMARLRARMGEKNYAIVESFCGHAFSARDSLVKAGIPFGNDSVFARLCEALDDLAEAMGQGKGRRAA